MPDRSLPLAVVLHRCRRASWFCRQSWSRRLTPDRSQEMYPPGLPPTALRASNGPLPSLGTPFLRLGDCGPVISDAPLGNEYSSGGFLVELGNAPRLCHSARSRTARNSADSGAHRVDPRFGLLGTLLGANVRRRRPAALVGHSQVYDDAAEIAKLLEPLKGGTASPDARRAARAAGRARRRRTMYINTRLAALEPHALHSPCAANIRGLLSREIGATIARCPPL
jgi:hypothetical protein